MTTIEKCPFCDSEPFVEFLSNDNVWRIACLKCGVSPNIIGKKEIIFKSWNKRP